MKTSTTIPFLPFLILPFFFISGHLFAQNVLQIEKYGSAKTKKIFIGEELEYRLKGTDEWRLGVIERLIPEQEIIVFGDRYINMKEIEALRYRRGWAKASRQIFFFFGAGWSGFALIGTATDGNPSTNYQWSDALVTGVSWLTAWLIPKIFKYKTVKLGKRRWLRMLDLSFKNSVPIQGA